MIYFLISPKYFTKLYLQIPPFHEVLFLIFIGAAGPRYSMDLGSDGYESPGSALMGRPGFGNFMPYGIRTPDSLMSTGSRDFASSAYGAGWKLPGKNKQ